MSTLKSKNIKVIDLFCGIGGLTHGFVKEGFNVVAGFDIDETCKYPFEENNNSNFFLKDIKDVTAKDLTKLFKGAKIKVLVGCAPCQTFSTYAAKSPDHEKHKEEGRWALLYEFGRLITESKPDIVSMENVPGLARFRKNDVFKDFLRLLSKEGYFIDFKEVYCPEYGIPQQRKRLVLLASKLAPIFLINKTHNKKTYITVKDTIGSLEVLEHGQISETDPLHRASKLSDVNLKRIAQSKPGGTWRDWDESLRLECHKKDSGKTYSSVYGRMKWDEPAPTMTTFCTGLGNGRFGHPEQDRAISLREAALFQTFPFTYKFYPAEQPLVSGNISTHIGNAVPVKLGEVIAKSIKFHLQAKF